MIILFCSFLQIINLFDNFSFSGRVMEKTFGAFIREKRLERGLKLKTFAQLVGISAVYESYIENGKRPAPSQEILQRIPGVLNLDQHETAQLNSAAILSHNEDHFPDDLLNYINSRPYVIDALRIAFETNASEEEWSIFSKLLSTNQKQE